jgi:DsbC/DsbD-like thiol-disulfide interchange protein
MRSFEKITKRQITKRKMISTDANQIHKATTPLRVLSSCALCFVLCAFSSVCAAPLSIELVSEVTSIQPGTPFYVGLHLKHQEHYHTYWKFPGIVGVPTGMAWKLPVGWKADPIEWPAPERVMMFQIKAQGYHGEVLLPMKITPPKDLAVGGKITLEGKATWMCCGLDCNPGFADLTVTLPVAVGTPTVDAKWVTLFDKARAGMPQPLAGYAATALREGARVTLRLTPQTKKDTDASFYGLPLPRAKPPRRANFLKRLFQDKLTAISAENRATAAQAANTAKDSEPVAIFFTEDGYINADKDQVFRKEGNDLVIELVISTYFTDAAPDELRGILWLKDGSLGKGAIIRAPFAK